MLWYGVYVFVCVSCIDNEGKSMKITKWEMQRQGENKEAGSECTDTE